ncbi:UDP-2-acetamido-2,6-beta-L-arabino-hexul-4-ose reductase [Ralstonia mannitolilytica]|uniref:UDP-2-acetamido-2,6-beta-L-arabino-hexul-4-ose reductase n=1 Tax=Ralstonia mannitolilytica TaxID=105219 RepID=UPI0028F516E7|nr:capsular polysaccharide biosynthesis protein CapF [Ralstonia mannitolilytica]CAJ0889106.1 UDP-2-acetamido-2,6-beta-L-arabino-hexul-4-ose reductase [Ralstonia mannitolilytica]
MDVLITGADGFVGKNLRLFLSERKDVQVHCFTRADEIEHLPTLLREADFVFHLAGVNRPQHPQEFASGNAGLTQALCQALCNEADATGRRIPVIYTSSTQANRDNAYGHSKRGAEDALFAARDSHGIPVHVFRLPNVFGKWCKPNYNSAIATFCYNTARGLPIQVNDPAAPVTLVYVDDVIDRFVQLMDGADAHVDADGFAVVSPQYTATVGELAAYIQSFRNSRESLVIDRVGTGLVRALYATYVSYLPVDSFAYTVPQYGDPRGVFVEMLKTPDCGQFSFFTAHPGITRGGHYHHTKTEKFLVIKGRARFKFRHMHTGETHELITSGEKAEIVETVPGWTHDITNIGEDEMIVMLWANEIFDRARPDTYACPL